MTLSENPACNPHCRACHYKHLTYSEQLTRKEAWARGQLAHWGEVLREIIPAPPEERIAYRAKSWMRSTFKDGALSFGMFRAVRIEGGWGKEFLSWDHCPLHVPAIQKMVDRLRKVLSGEAREFSEKSLLGVWFGSPHLVLVSRDENADVLSNVDWSKVLSPPFNRVWFHTTSQVGKKVFGAYEIRQISGPPANDLHPIRAFRQVAGSLLRDARTRAVNALLRAGPEMILDLFCGTGEISLMIPREVGWLGIEHSKEAVLHARTLRSSGSSVHEAYEGAVEQRLLDSRVLEKIPSSYAMYINPPRPGLGQGGRDRVRALIREKKPQTIAYLSCSASSLARDLAVLTEEGFRVESLQPYDFFPETEHFETLAILNRR